VAAGDVEAVARLVENLALPAYRQGRITPTRRWLQWLAGRGAIEGRLVVAVWASFFAGRAGHPAEAERWADAVDRWQYGDAARPADPCAEAWAALLRAVLARHGVKQLRADADEAARGLAAAGIVVPEAPLMRGIARVLGGDLDGGDRYFEDSISRFEDSISRFEESISVGEGGASHVLADALCQRSLRAMARDQWSQAGVFASRARSVLRRAGQQDTHAPLCGASPCRPAPGRRHRGPPGTRHCSTAPAFADLREPLHRRSDPDRADPRPPGPRRPRRCQDAAAGDRSAARAAPGSGNSGR